MIYKSLQLGLQKNTKINSFDEFITLKTILELGRTSFTI